jgi:hypothetical protein
MNTKIIAVAIVAVLALVALVALMASQNSSGNQVSSQGIGQGTGVTVSTTSVSDVSTVVDDGYASLMDAELSSMSSEQPEYVSQTQDSLAQDMSLFYY